MDAQSLQSLLQPLPITDLRYFSEIGSTNDEALEWISAGAPDGALIVADTQSAGRGRFSRKWVTRSGSALAFSLVMLPGAKETKFVHLFSPLGALAVRRAILRCCGLQPQIKWPNDVLLNDRKVCGILAEAAWTGGHLQGVVVGIGVNVASNAISPDDLYLFPATTVEKEAGRPINREELLFFILQSLFEIRPMLGSPEFFAEWQTNLAFKNQMVHIEQEGQPNLDGILLGIDGHGNLRVESNDGKEVSVMVGDVHLRPAGK